MEQFNSVVENIIQNNFDLSLEAKILVLGDISTSDLAKDFYQALLSMRYNVQYIEMEDLSRSGEEPPDDIYEEWTKHEIVFCLTKHSLTHTNARKNANQLGIQIITMPGVTIDMFLNGAMNADYTRVEKETLDMTNNLTEASLATIITGDGKYELSIPLENRTGVPSTGVFKQKGQSGNLPSGEAYIAPLEHKAQGEILITGSIAGIGLVDEPILLTIENGRLMQVTETTQGKKLLSILGDGDGRLLCEFGIGTNHAARITGSILEDEKAYNTIHVAFGANHTFGGVINTNVHIDCVTKNPIVKFK